MKDKEFVRKLKLLKYLRVGGEPSRDFVEKNREILMMQVQNTVSAPATAKREIGFAEIYGFVNSLMPRGLNQYVLRPALVIMFAFGAVFSGWIASVSASINSLPGDALYSLKIATEQAQLVFAGDNSRAKLQVEFAGRRLEEVAKIAENPNPEQEEIATMAVANFKEQMDSVKSSFEIVQQKSSPVEIAEVAKIVDRKTSEYHDVLVKTAESLPAPTQVRLVEAKNAVEETGIRAVQVIVENQLENKSVATDSEVLGKVQEKLNTVAGNVAGVAKITTVTSTKPAQEAASQAQTSLSEAKQLLENNDVSGAIAKIVEVNNLTKEAERVAISSGLIGASSTNSGATGTVVSGPVGIPSNTVTTTLKAQLTDDAGVLVEAESATDTPVTVEAQIIGGEEEIIIPETISEPEGNSVSIISD